MPQPLTCSAGVLLCVSKPRAFRRAAQVCWSLTLLLFVGTMRPFEDSAQHTQLARLSETVSEIDLSLHGQPADAVDDSEAARNSKWQNIRAPCRCGSARRRTPLCRPAERQVAGPRFETRNRPTASPSAFAEGKLRKHPRVHDTKRDTPRAPCDIACCIVPSLAKTEGHLRRSSKPGQ